MDWDKAIERNEIALLRIISAMFGLACSIHVLPGSGLMIPRRVWRAILIVLRPAEAAVRRLIIIAARHLKPVPVKSARAEFNIHILRIRAQPGPARTGCSTCSIRSKLSISAKVMARNPASVFPAKAKSTPHRSTPNPCTTVCGRCVTLWPTFRNKPAVSPASTRGAMPCSRPVNPSASA